MLPQILESLEIASRCVCPEDLNSLLVHLLVIQVTVIRLFLSDLFSVLNERFKLFDVVCEFEEHGECSPRQLQALLASQVGMEARRLHGTKTMLQDLDSVLDLLLRFCTFKHIKQKLIVDAEANFIGILECQLLHVLITCDPE